MNHIFASLANWIPVFIPLVCILAWLAIQSRWEAYTRRKNYEELKTLHELLEKSVITQAEFDARKEELLNA
jgi:hypothetical protein